MRVLAVAEDITAHKSGTFPYRKFCFALFFFSLGGGSGFLPELLTEPGRHSNIIGGSVAECVSSKFSTLLQRKAAFFTAVRTSL